ncbi:MAG: hypothetical protein MJY56_07495 [Bacteroidales bacterium]|nr:hypothetical protein [Bacteroidales bacterium]
MGSKGNRSTFADILEDVAGEGRRRVAAKVPSWADVSGLSFPTRLCTEQCSSEATARYKAGLAARLCGGRPFAIADLTGGLGVDSWAFSAVAGRVLHNEMSAELSSAVRSNFSLLGVSNVAFSSLEITPGNISEVLSPFLSGWNDRIIFIDPARRSATGSKVFRLEDCAPNVLGLLPSAFELAEHVVLKLSPMADIELLVRELDGVCGWRCREVHVAASSGECKEILVVMDKSGDNGYSVTCVEEDFTMTYSPAEEKEATVSLAPVDELSGKYLFEPGKSLTKAGAFKLICTRFGLMKFGVSTHLYLAGEPVPGIPGKWFLIDRALPFDKASIKELGREFPRCEVTSRNLPVTSDELRRRLGAKSGGSTHLFALHADRGAKNLLLVTTPYFRA